MSTPRVSGAALKAAYSVQQDALDQDDVERGVPVDATFILDEIRDRTGIHEPAEVTALFRRGVALANMLSELGVDDAVGLAEGDTIPDYVFEIAATLPMRETEDRSRAATCEFSKDEFLAAVCARRAN